MRRTPLVLVLLLVACSASTPSVDETNKPTPTGIATTPARRPAPVARQAVFAADDTIWLYDVARDSLREVAKGANLREPRWVGETEVSFVQGEAGSPQALRIVDIKRQEVRDVFTVATGIDTYGWSPDRETVAYLTTDKFSYPHLEYRSIGAGVTQSVATFARALGRDLNAGDQRRVAFDRTGRYVMVVNTYADGDDPKTVPTDQSQLQVRTLSGDLAFSVDHFRNPTMAEWGRGGRVLFYRNDSGVRSWVVGGNDSDDVASIRWFNPSSSPEGAYIAFDTGAVSRNVSVKILVLKGARQVQISKKGFYRPVAASPRVVWVQRVTPCEPDCPAAVTPAPEVFAVDIKTLKERKLKLPTLSDLDVRFA